MTKIRNPSFLTCGKLGDVSGKKNETEVFFRTDNYSWDIKTEARECEDECIVDEEDIDASTHFLRLKKINWIIWFNILRDTRILYQYLDSKVVGMI